MRHRRIALSLVIAVALFTGTPAAAVDGVIEINQVKALAGDVTPGDTAGYPVTLSASGSYRLTGPLSVANSGLEGITITADDVTLDLNGFTLAGAVTCSGLGSAVNCTTPGSGIHGVSAGTQQRVTVRNGIVRGFAEHGIALGEYARVIDVHVEQNGGNGVDTDNSADITRVSSAINGAAGVDVGSGSHLDGVLARSNKTAGIAAINGSVVHNSRAFDNGGDGFELTFGVVITSCTAYINEGNGIDTSGGSLVRGNLAYANGVGGVGYQLFLTSSTAYLENVMTQSSSLGNVFSGENAGGNVCDGSPCP